MSVIEQRPNTRANPVTKRSLPGEVATASTMTPSPSKRGRSTETDTPVVVTPPNVTPPNNVDRNVFLFTDTYWESPEALRLFCPNILDEEDSALPVIQRRIERFKQGYATAEGWKLVLDDFDQNKLCSAFDIFNIQMKCRYVVAALKVAIQEMPTLSWRQCLNKGVSLVNELEGVQHIKNGETVRIWHQVIRENNECFPNPQVVRRGMGP